MSNDQWRVSVGGNKYTVIGEPGKGLTFLRHGEPWPAAEDWRFAGAIYALAAELRQARRALVLVAALGRGELGMLEAAVAFQQDYGIGFVDFTLELERALARDEGTK